ncbi:MAG: hypothetical protein ACLQBB_11965 [Solirubrobacteraceae bacterium]
MAHPAYLREKARALRVERKLTIDQLAERLALPRSTIYHWVRDMPIPGSGPGGDWPESARRKGTRAMQRKYRLLREAAYREGLESYAGLMAEPTFRDFVCLYIAEGYKRSRNTVELCNSDPSVMILGSRWLERLGCRAARYSVQHHRDQDLDELREFWGEILRIDPLSIRLKRKSNSGQMQKRLWRSRYGVLSASVNDTLLRARLQAWMDRVRESWL